MSGAGAKHDEGLSDDEEHPGLADAKPVAPKLDLPSDLDADISMSCYNSGNHVRHAQLAAPISHSGIT